MNDLIIRLPETRTAADMEEGLKDIGAVITAETGNYIKAARAYYESYTAEIDGSAESLQTIEEDTAEIDRKKEALKKKMGVCLTHNDYKAVSEIEEELQELKESREVIETRREALAGYVPSGSADLYAEAEKALLILRRKQKEAAEVEESISLLIKTRIEELEALRENIPHLIRSSVLIPSELRPDRLADCRNNKTGSLILAENRKKEQEAAKLRAEAIERQHRREEEEEQEAEARRKKAAETVSNAKVIINGKVIL